MIALSDHSHLRVKYADGGVTVRLIGCERLNETVIPAVQKQLFGLAEELGSSDLRLDLGGIRFLGSTGLGMLLALHKRLQATGSHLSLCGVNDTIHEVFEITHLTRVLDVRREHAIAEPAEQPS